MNQAMQYRQLDVVAQVHDASPHRLVQMMFEGALARLALVRGQILRQDFEGKANTLSSIVAIVGGLRDCLDLERGGELAANLDSLYDYMQLRLFRAGADNDAAAVDEVVALLLQIKGAWDQIGPNAETAAVEARG